MSRIIILAIKGYRFFVSPLLPGACRFTPTCSCYSIDAVRKYGALKGLALALGRVLRCHPFHSGGYDPVR